MNWTDQWFLMVLAHSYNLPLPALWKKKMHAFMRGLCYFCNLFKDFILLETLFYIKEKH